MASSERMMQFLGMLSVRFELLNSMDTLESMMQVSEGSTNTTGCDSVMFVMMTGGANSTEAYMVKESVNLAAGFEVVHTTVVVDGLNDALDVNVA